uniref:DM domain-containing protein n=1 Tax=Plectus sambesii TaxID=2011161 RepID=A0A914V6E9_9BILA
MPKDQYMCQLCANHGIFNQPKKGHKQKCPYKTCECNLCALNTKRRTLDQIERQLKNTSGPADFDPHQKGSSSYAGLTINKNMETPSTSKI